MKNNQLNLVLCWHMHQPWYRESQDGDYRLPWVYLHALKDYVDMVAHLEAHPQVRAVVNFTPVLLEQLDDYAQQFDSWLNEGSRFSEPLLNLLSGVDAIPKGLEEREVLIRHCMRAYAPHMIDAYPPFKRLLGYVQCHDGQSLRGDLIPYLNDQYFLDLLTWYHIAWLGHSLKRRSDVQRLMRQESNFDAAARRHLFSVMNEAFESLIDRYRALAEVGQIELSMTPYSHPIIPLLLDFESVRCALPHATMPTAQGYPGGLERARWQMEHGLKVFERYFGQRPRGVWLSEGAVSEAAITLLSEYGFEWSASGEGVWHNSHALSEHDTHHADARRTLFQCHELKELPTRLFFRDDGLSDRIGFEYQNWRAEDAAKDFIRHLENIRNYLGDEVDHHVVSVILDGENAWEYYPDNAFHFLGALYQQLAECDFVNLCTFAEANECCPPTPLPRLCAGSWVYGTFSTWMGDPDKNRGWDRLVEAKLVYDEVMASKTLKPRERAKAERQLAICEGSDWFWWFGGYNPADSVRDFDQVYRKQLKNLYRLLKREIPAILDEPLSVGGGDAENAGTMRRGHEH